MSAGPQEVSAGLGVDTETSEESLLVRLAYVPVNLLQSVGIIVWCVFWMSLAILSTLVTLKSDVALKMARVAWAPGILWILRARVRVEPLPKVDWSQPHIFIMNHQSMVDIPCAFTALPANIRFVAKHTLKYFPFLGWYMWATGMIFINRSNRREAVASLALAGERIRAGANILAFPEGTRSRDGRVLPFKKGPFALAVEAQVSIIPVAIQGTHKVLPRGGLRYRPHQVRLKVGQPIPTAGLKAAQRDALIHEVRQSLVRLHADIGGPGAVAEDIAAVGVEGVAAR